MFADSEFLERISDSWEFGFSGVLVLLGMFLFGGGDNCTTFFFWGRHILRTTEPTDLHLCAAVMGTPLGPKLVVDAKASLAQRNMEGELTSRLNDAFGKLPPSYGHLATGPTSISTWFFDLA